MNEYNGGLPPRSRGAGSDRNKTQSNQTNQSNANRGRATETGRSAGTARRESGSAARAAASAARKKPAPTRKRRSPLARFTQVALTLVLAVALVVVGYFLYVYYKLDNGVFDAGVDRPVAAGQSAKEKPLTMLILGTDNRPKHPSNLTDVIMVASFNPEQQAATIVSLPRDTLVQLKGYKQTKINEFYARFKGKEDETGLTAEDEMKTMMSKYLNVPVDYVTVLDFQGFRDVVDELGKVSVNISADMCYTDSVDGTDINLKKGPAKLDGDGALDYVRYRKSNCTPKTAGSDDFDRNRRQNEVLHALIDRMQSLGGIVKIGGVIDAVGQNMQTDMEKDQIKNMIAAYWRIDKQNVEFKPVTGTWRSPYVYINEEELEAASQALQKRLAGTNGS